LKPLPRFDRSSLALCRSASFGRKNS